MKKKILAFIIIFLTIFQSKIFSSEIINLASVNHYLITNIDLENEIKILKYINGNTVTENQKKILLNLMIEFKIKELEVKKSEIKFDEKNIFEDYEIIKKKLYLIDISDNEKKNLINIIKKKLLIEYSWNQILLNKLQSKFDINQNEINKISKQYKLDKEGKEKIIRNEKNKKILSLKQSYFNEIKKLYLIKKF